MSLARAFTKRGKRPEVSAPMPYYGDASLKSKNGDEAPKAKGHSRFNSGTIKRGNISGPVQLISTTNMLAYNAPDLSARLNTQSIPPLDPVSASADSSASSLRSPHDWEAAQSPHDYSSAITTPDDSAPKTFLIDDNSYFPKRTATVGSQPRSSTTSSASSMDAPKPPQRALSHTKRSHQELARQRSMSRLSPPPLAPPMNASRSNPGVRASQDMFNPESHPFSKELEQVNEVAEEFGIPHVLDEEEVYLSQRGLHKFDVEDYLLEVEELYGSIFNDKTARTNMNPWF